MSFNVIQLFFPEFFLGTSILCQFLVNTYLITSTKYKNPLLDNTVEKQVFFILICTFLLTLNNYSLTGCDFNGTFIINETIVLYKQIFLIISFFCLILVTQAFRLQELNFFEFYTLYLMAVLAALLLFSTNNFLMAYLVLELQALSFYILASFKRDSVFSSEAGLKYFVTGSVVAGIFLFGCSLIYGVLGTINFQEITLLTYCSIFSFSPTLGIITMCGFLFILISLLFKLAIAPFHFWAPDVYDGSPLATTFTFSLLPKLPLLVFFIKVLLFLNNSSIFIIYFLSACGLFSLFFGVFFAIRQASLKRFFIYSSLSQFGILILILAEINIDAITYAFFYLFTYLLSSYVNWLLYLTVVTNDTLALKYNKDKSAPLTRDALANLAFGNFGPAAWFIFLNFSFAGIPPLVGFFIKFFALSSLMTVQSFITAFIAIMLTGIAVFYYLRIIKIIFFENDKKNTFSQNNFSHKYLYVNFLLINFGTFLLIYLSIFPSSLMALCQFLALGFF